MKNLSPSSHPSYAGGPNSYQIKEFGILGLVVFIVCLFIFVLWYMYRGGEPVHPSQDIEMNNRV